MNLPENKFFFTIGEVSEHLGETQATLRHWEANFDILSPGLSEKGTRKYSKNDVKAAELIQFLLREQGYTIEGAKKYLQRHKKTGINNNEIYETLLDIRKQLYDIRAELSKIKEDDTH